MWESVNEYCMCSAQHIPFVLIISLLSGNDHAVVMCPCLFLRSCLSANDLMSSGLSVFMPRLLLGDIFQFNLVICRLGVKLNYIHVTRLPNKFPQIWFCRTVGYCSPLLEMASSISSLTRAKPFLPGYIFRACCVWYNFSCRLVIFSFSGWCKVFCFSVVTVILYTVRTHFLAGSFNTSVVQGAFCRGRKPGIAIQTVDCILLIIFRLCSLIGC